MADYARVPLLNPDQLVSSWRELLSPSLTELQEATVTLGQCEPGVYLVEAVNGNLRAYTIAIVTDLTMIHKTSPDGEVVVYAVDRKSGAPRQGVHVEVVRGKKTLATGFTDRSGILKTRIKKELKPQGNRRPGDSDPEAVDDSEGRDAYLIMAIEHDHFGISDTTYFGLNLIDFGGDEELDEELLMGYIYTDRPVYRPGQKVYFKGILRRLGEGGYQMVGERAVNVTVESPTNGKIWDKDLLLSSRGTFSGEVELPDGAPLGVYRIIVQVGDATTGDSFEVQEYKKPEYRVNVIVPKKFVPVGETAKFTVEVRYFFGAPVMNADAKYYIYRSRYYPWWGNGGNDPGEGVEEEDVGGYYYYDYGGYGDDMVRQGEGVLDANGRLEIEFQVPPLDEKDPWDYAYRLEAQVTDSSRRTIDGNASFVGTRGSIGARVRSERYVYYQGDSARIHIKTTDYEGRPVAARVTLKFIEQKWERVEKEPYSEYKMHERELASVDVSTNAQGKAIYDYRVPTIPIVESIYIKPIIHEGGKQITFSGNHLWVADRSNRWSDFSYRDDYGINLVPDKKSYRPGETAHVLAILPTDRAHLLVTTELMHVMTVRQIDAVGRAVMIDVPIEARYAPNVYLGVAYVKDDMTYSSLKWEGMLAVPARDKFLTLEIIPDKKEYKPRETATYTILARNADGSPAAGAEVSLGVVDEAIYSIRWEWAWGTDIRRAFCSRRYNRVDTGFQTWYSFSGYAGNRPPEWIVRRKASNQLADFKYEGQYAEATIRKEFKDTAYWKPDVVTGAYGKATVSVTLPDNLTTWRATARAVTGDTRIRSIVSKVLARKDLILRLEKPRFLTEGDTVTLSGIVHNYLPADKVTKISIEVTGARLLDPAEQTVTIPQKGEHRIDWHVVAGQVGEVRLLARALTNVESDAVEMPLPVVPAGLRRTMGGATTLSEENAEETFSLDLPANAHEQARSLRIEVSPSIAGTLFSALDYLTGYPYGCTEQTMSRFLPNVIVAQALKEVKTASIRAPGDLDRKVQRGLGRLYDYQHVRWDDQYGIDGWGWWKDDSTDPFMTAYVVDGLTMASHAGYAVDRWRMLLGRNSLEATALSLKALAQILPQSPLLPKVARWLVTHRRNGYFWDSTRQTAFAIFGLTDYLRVSQELSPDYTVEVYLNGEPVLTRRITSADAAAAQSFVIERKGSAVGSANQVRVVKRGRGQLYLSTNLSYFTQGEAVAAQASADLQLIRKYLRLRVTESDGKPEWTVEPLTGELRSGDLIVSRLRVLGLHAQYLMIEDPIPAGCEQIEQVSGLRLDYQEGRWSDWYSAREFRDQKTAFFVTHFIGNATFQYALRVQVPGEFRVAPARAELMYQPTVQSNTATVRLKILEKGNGVKR